MAKYVYKKFANAQEYGFVVTSPATELNYSPTQFVDGYSNRSLNKSTGSVSYTGSIRLYGDDSGDLQYQSGSSHYTFVFIGDGRVYRTIESVQLVNVRGAQIGQVIAEDGTLPTNGRHTDGFWYQRMYATVAPVVTSPNGGESFDESETITWTHSQTGFTYRIELSLDNGGTWTTLGTAPLNATSFAYDFTNTTDSSLALIRVTPLKDSLNGLSDTSDGVFSISHNTNPTAPSNLSPSGNIVDRTKTIRLSWQHNDAPGDTQSKADIRWRVVGATTWTDITSNGPDEEYFLSPSTVPNGQIEWQVRTYDNTSLESPWSNLAVFTAAEPTAAPTITQPGSSVSIARPVIEWTSSSQSAYQIVVEDTLNAVVWDTGEVTSTVKARTVGVDLVNGGTYTIKVRVKDGSGLFSSYTSKVINVSYTPPATPSIEVEVNGSGLSISFEHPTPEGTQPTVSQTNLLKETDGEWVKVAENIESPYIDYMVKSGVSHSYRVEAIGDNGTIALSDVGTNMTTFRGSYLHLVDEPSTLLHMLYMDIAKNEDHSTPVDLRRYQGRTKRVAVFAEFEDLDFTLTYHLKKDTGQYASLKELWREQKPFVYRDFRGRLIVGVIPALPFVDTTYGQTVTITLSEVDYREGVE